ncbi:MAG: sugar kinase [Chloroflexi bacterium]|nr:sugar kinase [Chloroflexota bacterium]
MSILVVGSVALDSVKTPAGSRQDALGGSATYFAVASSYFAPVSVVAAVGDDFRAEDRRVLEDHHVDMAGLAIFPGKTFRWVGEYGQDMNTAHTLDTQLNVFARFSPRLGPDQRKRPFLFLANIDPELQQQVLYQMEERPKLVVGDTMDFWIRGKPQALRQVIANVDILMVNEAEARQLTGETSLVRAARHLLRQGPRMVVVKRGEYGALGFTADATFATPAYPLETVVDPTGAGDSFAGGFLGYLAASGDLTLDGFHRAMVVGSVMASFTVESFGLERLRSLTPEDIQERYQEFWRLTYFGSPADAPLPVGSPRLPGRRPAGARRSP